MKKSEEREFVALALERYDNAVAAETENDEHAEDDLRYIRGLRDDQWTAEELKDRKGRPTMTINRLPAFVQLVEGEMRMAKPSIQVLPVDDQSDPDTADAIEGMIRNIEYQSNVKAVYPAAFRNALQAGKGFLRIETRYIDNSTFDQEIRIRNIRSPFAVRWDPMAEDPALQDARWIMVVREMDLEEFKAKYPDAGVVDIPTDGEDERWGEWITDETVRVAEYFVKTKEVKTLYLTSLGRVLESKETVEESAGEFVVAERDAEEEKIDWYLISGADVLEGPTPWAGTRFPIVPIWGREIYVEGQTYRYSLIRYAKESQRMYNFWRSTVAETLALQPKAPYLITAKQIGQYRSIWDRAHKKPFPFLPYEADPMVPGPPARQEPPTPPTALWQEGATSSQEMKDVTGLHEASFGMRSNETSGVAIAQRQQAGGVSTQTFHDNFAGAVRQVGRILVDLIPVIYDAERLVRITGVDGKTESIRINATQQEIGPDGKPAPMYDMTVGKYDVRVDVGPSFATQRQEAAASMTEFVRAWPQAAPLIGDLIAKNQDWPGAQEIAKRLQVLLPPELRPQEAGVPPSPASTPPPDPEKMLDIEKAKIQLEQERIQLEQEKIQLQQEMAKLRKELTPEPARNMPATPAATDAAGAYYGKGNGGPVDPSKVRWLQ